MSSSKAELKPATQELHGVPLTLEGSSVLHQMFRFRWADWRKLAAAQQDEIATEARTALEKMEHHVSGQSALFSMLGHKAERSEEHTSELQSRQYLVCRLLLEKKKKK